MKSLSYEEKMGGKSMNKLLKYSLISLVLLAGCTPKENKEETQMETGVIRTTTDGQIEGLYVNEEKVVAWYGVPYAQAPVEDLRWKEPQPNIAWEGILETKQMPVGAIQKDLQSGNVFGEEDCLKMNIYRPNTDEVNLPIMVFVHGGGNQNGTSSSLVGDSLAIEANAIIISIDYRVGVLGFVSMEALRTGNSNEDSGNFGLLDIAQSLRWIKENAAVFGGDANNITLSGQSAGGRDVLAAMISPEFEGLFDKAIAISGGMTTSTLEEGETVANQRLATILVQRQEVEDLESGIQWIEAASNEEVKEMMYSLTDEEIASFYDAASIRLAPFPQLYLDGNVLPKNGFEAFATGDYHQVPLMLTSCESEFSMFGLADPALLQHFFARDLADQHDLAVASKLYGSQLYASFNTDRVAELVVENNTQPTVYVSRFAWGEDAEVSNEFYSTYVGATHGADMDFINGQYISWLDAFAGPLYTDENLAGRQALSSQMQHYLGNFMRTGNPNGENLPEWTGWTNNEDEMNIMVLDANNEEAISAMENIRIDEDSVWKAIEDEVDPEIADQLLNSILKGRFFDQR